MRKLAIALLCSATAASASQVSNAPAERVYLDRPGALDAIEQANPETYRRITQILYLAGRMPCHTEGFGRALKARFDADGGCALALLTSFPAKRHLAFTLDGTTYMAVVTMTDSGGRVVPVR